MWTGSVAGLVIMGLAGFVEAFEPTNLTGCVMWLRAAEENIQTNPANGRVSQWNDLSGNGNHAAQSSGQRQPLYQAEGPGGWPALFFDRRNYNDGQSAGLLTTNYLNGAYSVFVVAQVVDASERGFTWRRIVPARDANWLLGTWPDGGTFYAHAQHAMTDLSSCLKSVFTFNRVYTLAAVNTLTEQRFFVNGYDLTSDATRTTGPGRLTIGGAGSISQDPSDALISEVIVYESALSATDRQQVEAYLAARYGVTPEGFDGPVWSGAGSDHFWSTADNWQQALPAEPALAFVGSARRASMNDLTGLTLHHVLVRDNTWSFLGNPVSLKTDFMSFTSGTVDWALDTVLPEGPHLFSVRNDGKLNMNGLLSGAGGVTAGMGTSFQGTLNLACPSNTFTGPALLKYGITEVTRLANAGVPSSLGAAIGADAAIRLGNYYTGGYYGMRYTGTEPFSTDRPFLFLRGVTIENNSPADAGGAFNGNWSAMEAPGGITATLTLAGTSKGVNTVNGVIANAPGGANSLIVKITSGVWAFSAANTFTGGLTVEGGSVLVNGTDAGYLGAGNVTVKAGAVLGGSGRLAGYSSLALLPGSVLVPGNPDVDGGIGTLTFSAAPALNGMELRCQATAQTNDLIRIETAWSPPGFMTVRVEADSEEACPERLTIIEAASLTGSADLSGWDIEAPCAYRAVVEGNAVVLMKEPPPDLAAWQRSMPVRFSGYDGVSELTNFPALIKLSDGCGNGRFRYADCLAGGADLLFTDETGARLDHEIETWNTNGESHVWVRVPRLVRNTEITAHWKNPARATDANPFLPTDLTGCAMWLHAGAGVTADGAGLVSRWADQSGNGHEAVRGDSRYQPCLTNNVVNGLPGLRFEGDTYKDGLITTWGTSNGTYSVFVTASYQVSTTYSWYRLATGPANYNWGIELNGSGGDFYSFIPNGAGGNEYYQIVNTGIRPAGGVPFTAAILGDGTNTQFTLNGFGFTPIAKHHGPGTLILGHGGISGNPWLGHIFEVIVYSRALGFEERRQVERYLALKYGIRSAHLTPSAGLVQWLRAENAIADVADGAANRVKRWDNQTQYGSGVQATQATTNRMPEKIAGALNGKPVLRFDAAAGEYDSLKAVLASVDKTYSVIAVFAPRSADPAERIVLQGVNGASRLSVTNGLVTRQASGTVSQLAPAQVNRAAIAVMTCDAQASRFYLNGVNLTQNSAPVGLWKGTGSSVIYLGAGTGDGALDLPLDGDLAEVLVYDRLISDTERRRIEADLSERYAIPVARVNPAVWSSEFGGVWHFTGTDRLLLADASAAQNGAALLGQAAPAAAAALAGEGLAWDAAAQAGRTRAQPAAVPQTFSFWAKQQAPVADQAVVLAGTGAVAYAALDNAAEKLEVAGTDAADLTAPNAAGWTHYAVTVNPSGSVQAYGNGEPLTTVPNALAALLPVNQALTLGHAGDETDNTKTFSGVLDEVRIETVPRGADWIRAAYMTQAENESFTSYNRWGTLMLMR